MKQKPAKKPTPFSKLVKVRPKPRYGTLFVSKTSPNERILITSEGRSFLIKNKLIGENSLLRYYNFKKLFPKERLVDSVLGNIYHVDVGEGKAVVVKRGGKRLKEMFLLDRKMIEGHKKLPPAKYYNLEPLKVYALTPKALVVEYIEGPTIDDLIPYRLDADAPEFTHIQLKNRKKFMGKYKIIHEEARAGPWLEKLERMRLGRSAKSRKKVGFSWNGLRRAYKELVERLDSIAEKDGIYYEPAFHQIIVRGYDPNARKFNFVIFPFGVNT